MLFTDLKIPCPYDRAHMIYESKMQSHLVKCERNNKNTNKVVCPFNAVHRIDDKNYIVHITSCPNRRIIEDHVYFIEELSAFEPTPYVQPPLPPQEEDWDLDPPGRSYNPKFYVDRTCVLRCPVGITKSERKAFYIKEVKKFNKFRNNEIIYTSESDSEEQSGSGNSTVSSSSTFGYVNEKMEPQTITRTSNTVSSSSTFGYVNEKMEPQTITRTTNTVSSSSTFGYVNEKMEPQTIRRTSNTVSSSSTFGYVNEKMEPQTITRTSNTVSSSSTFGYVNEKMEPQTITRTTNSLISYNVPLSPLLGLGRGTNFQRKSQIAAEKKPGKSLTKGTSSNFSLNEEMTRNQFMKCRK